VTHCKVLTVIGTRPEVIKLAPVIMQLEHRTDRFVSRVCATAQHRQMLDQALAPFGINPDHDLDIMTEGQTLAQVTSRAIERLDQVVVEEQPTSCWCKATQQPLSVAHLPRTIARLRSATSRRGFVQATNTLHFLRRSTVL
jgi:hypothetical protein